MKTKTKTKAQTKGEQRAVQRYNRKVEAVCQALKALREEALDQGQLIRSVTYRWAGAGNWKFNITNRRV